MKTTINISNFLLARSKKIARQEHLTLRELVEEGLSLVVARHTQSKTAHVKPVTFKSKGLAPEFQQGGWSDKITQSRG